MRQQYFLRLALVGLFGVLPAETHAAEDATPVPAKPAEQPLWSYQADLTIGDAAPTLDIEYWVHDGEGRFPHLTEFEPGRIVVVEFWATWCGPCIAAMPHVVELQKANAEHGVQIVSVSDEPIETVEAMMLQPVRGAEDQTYNQLTSSYCLTTDPDRSVWDAYMKASGCSGIPNAFIVGKSGLIEWIGHPMTLDEPLQQVINDAWDRDAFAKEFDLKKQLEMTHRAIAKTAMAGDIAGARALLAKAVETAPSEEAREQVSGVESMLQTIEHQSLMQNDAEKAIAMQAEMIEQADDKAAKTMELTVSLLQTTARGGKIAPGVTEATLQHISDALADDPGRYKIGLLALSAELYQRIGKLQEAVTTLEQLIESYDESHPQVAPVKERLAKLKAKLAATQQDPPATDEGE